MTPPLLFIVGVQKSGTTLLSRLCQEEGIAINAFKTEGNDFFGNEPPFTPTGDPAGSIYQARQGERGHVIDREDATEEMSQVLRGRLAELVGTDARPVLNKNPYNSVRVGWLRALFPSAIIVAMVRDPVANAYSLAKKYVPHEGRGLPPDEGFWGVKPSGWRNLVSDDKLLQSAAQWREVNRAILRDRDQLDRILVYSDLCENPTALLTDIERRLSPSTSRSVDVAPLPCFDDEHRRGSRLRSKNRYYKEMGSLEVPEEESIEFPPIARSAELRIRAITEPTWAELQSASAS